MAKHSKTNVIPLEKQTVAERTSADNLRLAERKLQEAREKSGNKRMVLAQQALAISEECVDAYVFLAGEMDNYTKRLPLYRKAIEVAERQLGTNWEKKYKSDFWSATETRPIMRAMAGLALALQWEDQLPEAVALYQKLMKLNPKDNQGIRYLLAGCLFEAGCDDKLEELLDQYSDDERASLAYTKALYRFRKKGDSKKANKALLEAFKTNNHVPMYLSDLLEMPIRPPTSIEVGKKSEAIAYIFDNNYLWYDTEGATAWMSEILAPELRKTFDDTKLVEDVIKELKGEFDD